MSTTSQQRDPAFPSTRWTLVTIARNPDDPDAGRALEKICVRYWYPVYAFLRRCGASPEDAEDTTQNLFARIHDFVSKADSEKGRLRSFFMKSAKNLLADDRKRSQRKKRGGDVAIESLDSSAEDRYRIEPIDPSATPEEFYEYVWAKEIVLRCLDAVGNEWEVKDRRSEFDAIKPLVLRPMVEFDASVTRESAREKLGISDASLRQKIKSLRDRLWSVLASEVSSTLADPEGPGGVPAEQFVTDEVAHLFSVLLDRRHATESRGYPTSDP